MTVHPEAFTGPSTGSSGVPILAMCAVVSSSVNTLKRREIFLNSVDRDGAKQGYDIGLLQKISEAVSIPVIACGGVGHPEHFVDALSETKVSAVAAGNFFHFSEHSAIIAKAFVEKNRIDARLDPYATYRDFNFCQDGRVDKRPDSYLDELRFFKIAKEVI